MASGGLGDHPVNPHGGHEQSRERKDTEHRAEDIEKPMLMFDQLTHGFDLKQRQIRVHVLHDAAQGSSLLNGIRHGADGDTHPPP